MRILMVCLGNICRSPIAEGVLRHMAQQHKLDWVIDSAGTESFHVGEAPHKFSQKICLSHGIDISAQRARKFTTVDFDNYDKIYVMAHDVYREVERIGGKHAQMNKVDYFLNELHEGQNENVPDPWYGGEEGFTPVYNLIEKTCKEIIKHYAHNKA